MTGSYRSVPSEGGLVGESSPTGVAHERLLPGVYSMVPLQRVQLRELLTTLVTAIGSFTSKQSTALKG